MAFTPLSIAAQIGDVQDVLTLLEAGADINACNHIGWTPLSMAAGNGHDRVVKALIEVGVWTLTILTILVGHLC